MDDELKDKLTAYAKENDLSIAHVMRKAIVEFLKRHEKE
jgi:predicted transcriptional regulator